jgi:hypothetical protein
LGNLLARLLLLSRNETAEKPTPRQPKERAVSKPQKRSNREQKKPKQEKPKVIAAAASVTALPLKTGGLPRGKTK